MAALRSTHLAWLLLSALTHASGNCNADGMECLAGSITAEHIEQRTMLQRVVGEHQQTDKAEEQGEEQQQKGLWDLLGPVKDKVKEFAKDQMEDVLKKALEKLPDTVLAVIEDFKQVQAALVEAAGEKPEGVAAQLLDSIELIKDQVQDYVNATRNKLVSEVKGKIHDALGLMQVETKGPLEKIKSLVRELDGLCDKATDLVKKLDGYVTQLSTIGDTAIAKAIELAPAKSEEFTKVRITFEASIKRAKEAVKKAHKTMAKVGKPIDAVHTLLNKLR